MQSDMDNSIIEFFKKLCKEWIAEWVVLLFN